MYIYQNQRNNDNLRCNISVFSFMESKYKTWSVSCSLFNKSQNKFSFGNIGLSGLYCDESMFQLTRVGGLGLFPVVLRNFLVMHIMCVWIYFGIYTFKVNLKTIYFVSYCLHYVIFILFVEIKVNSMNEHESKILYFMYVGTYVICMCVYQRGWYT